MDCAGNCIRDMECRFEGEKNHREKSQKDKALFLPMTKRMFCP